MRGLLSGGLDDQGAQASQAERPGGWSRRGVERKEGGRAPSPGPEINLFNRTRQDLETGGAAHFSLNWTPGLPLADLGHPIPGSRYTCQLGVLETPEPWVAPTEKAVLSEACSRTSSLLSPS